MSNVIALRPPKKPNLPQRQAAFMRCFAQNRRRRDDVFWLKENAELLNVLANGKANLTGHHLDVFRPYYQTLEERMKFFPQYYRFILSICLDLEDLGFEGETGQKLCAYVADAGLPRAEMSDLQRAEAQRLLARRNIGAPDNALKQRLQDFIERTDTFSLPNKKAAYELTHIVFYLTDYGRRPISLSQAALTSLEYAGLLALLDQDVDLLSEVCVAMRFAGQTPSDIWENWLARELVGFRMHAVPAGPVNDAYHEYLVTNWWADISGRPAYQNAPPADGIEFVRSQAATGPLRAMSEIMFQLGTARSGDWSRMRSVLDRTVSPEHRHIIHNAAQSSNNFDSFFEGFARARV